MNETEIQTAAKLIERLAEITDTHAEDILDGLIGIAICEEDAQDISDYFEKPLYFR